ncbi:MAG TPA: hypothetical protein VGB55_10550 [Tepidisphaeraceae bacterium]
MAPLPTPGWRRDATINGIRTRSHPGRQLMRRLGDEVTLTQQSHPHRPTPVREKVVL